MNEALRRGFLAVSTGARTAGWRPRSAPIWKGLILAVCGCADILGLQEGTLSSGLCEVEADCGGSESCIGHHCIPKTCNEGQRRCDGLTARRCSPAQTWEREECPAMCTRGQCVTPKSCAIDNPSCAGTSCCASIAVGPDSFQLSYAYREQPDDAAGSGPVVSVPRKIRAFTLDRFEVSASRFFQFLDIFDREGRPDHPNAGAHPAFPDSGWQAQWSEDPTLLPANQFDLERVLHLHEQATRSNADLEQPIRGVNWYTAFAFCIWDGARLPTEAEWAYAASAGEQRVYPWPNTDLGPDIDHDRAQYTDDEITSEGPARVGAHAAGEGPFGHDDLAGNLAEWVADAYQLKLSERCPEPDASGFRQECMVSEGSRERVVRGGSYLDPREKLRNAERSSLKAATATEWIGFRCARDVMEP